MWKHFETLFWNLFVAREGPPQKALTHTDQKPTAEQKPQLKINAESVEAHRFSFSCVQSQFASYYCIPFLFPGVICKVL